MIDEIDARLQTWASEASGGARVSLGPPGRAAAEAGEGVGLYLLELGPLPPARGVRRPPLRVQLRYLVTVWSERPEGAHQLLGRLVFAALEQEAFEVDLEPAPLALWRALEAMPQPSFRLGVPLSRERPEPVVPRVLVPPVVRAEPLASLRKRPPTGKES